MQVNGSQFSRVYFWCNETYNTSTQLMFCLTFSTISTKHSFSSHNNVLAGMPNTSGATRPNDEIPELGQLFKNVFGCAIRTKIRPFRTKITLF